MEKRINVQAHLKRYVETHVDDKLALIKGLQDLVENDRKALIEKMTAHIESLKNGEFPEPLPKKAPRVPGQKHSQAAVSANEVAAETPAVQQDEVPSSGDL